MVAAANAPVVRVVRPVVLAEVVVPARLAMLAPVPVLIVPGRLLVVLTVVGPILAPITAAVVCTVVVPAPISRMVAVLFVIVLRLVLSVAIPIGLVLAVPAVIPARFAVLIALAVRFAIVAIVGQVTVQVGAIAVRAAFLVRRAVLVTGDIAATGFGEPMAALRPVWTADSVPSPAAGDLTGPLAQGTFAGRVVGRPAQSTKAWSELRTRAQSPSGPCRLLIGQADCIER
jgi:hypothetical protein